jgi:hypothetical protein
MVPILKWMVLVLGITAAAMAEAMKLQKMKLMAMNTLQGNGSQNGTESEPDDLNSNTGESLQEPKKSHFYSFIVGWERRGVRKEERIIMHTFIIMLLQKDT